MIPSLEDESYCQTSVRQIGGNWMLQEKHSRKWYRLIPSMGKSATSSHPILFWNSISEPTKQHPQALVYSRMVCPRLVSKVNIKKCIMWSKYLRSWGADGEIISHLLASFRSAQIKFDKSQRLHLTYDVCYPPLNMLASQDMDIHLVGRYSVCSSQLHSNQEMRPFYRTRCTQGKQTLVHNDFCWA